MMLQEFIDRTGFEPTDDEYERIQQEYYSFDGDKDAYCKAFVEGGGITKIAKARAERIRQLDGRILEMEHEARSREKELQKSIADLKYELDRELEWKVSVNEDHMRQSDYERLAADAECGCAHYMTDDEAKAWIGDEFGFDPAKVEILHEIPQYEINRHGRLRKTGKMIDRRPIYCATDYQYVRFDVCGIFYECWCSGLYQLDD